MNQKIRVLFSAPYEFLVPHLEDYKKEFEIVFHEIWTENDFPSDLSNYIAWIPNPGQNFIINTDILKNFNSLKIISTPSTGTNHINIQDCRNLSIDVFGLLDQRTGLEEISASAEFTFLTVLASIRKIRLAWHEVELNRWRHHENEMRGFEVNELSFGIVGMGRIGNNLVRYLQAFNAKQISFCDINIENDKLHVASKVSIEDIFQKSDVIIICVALNDETENLVDSKLILSMKANSILVNTSRGEVINEDDLIKALHARPDISFSADVLAGEVNKGKINQSLVKMHKEKRINITPHIAGATLGSQVKAASLAMKAIYENV